MRKKPVQFTLQIVFADIDADGEIGDLSQPVQLTISPREWKSRWQTKHSSAVLDNVVTQLDAPSNGAPVESPAPSAKPKAASKK